jgi:hypothetical protein
MDDNFQINEIKETINNIANGLSSDEYVPKDPYEEHIKTYLFTIPKTLKTSSSTYQVME